MNHQKTLRKNTLFREEMHEFKMAALKEARDIAKKEAKKKAREMANHEIEIYKRNNIRVFQNSQMISDQDLMRNGSAMAYEVKEKMLRQLVDELGKQGLLVYEEHSRPEIMGREYLMKIKVHV